MGTRCEYPDQISWGKKAMSHGSCRTEEEASYWLVPAACDIINTHTEESVAHLLTVMRGYCGKKLNPSVSPEYAVEQEHSGPFGVYVCVSSKYMI